MPLVEMLFGRPLASDEDKSEKIGPASGIPIFGLDALGSAAYGPEAALTLLIPLGAAGVAYILPITGCILALLVVLYFSYRQTIVAYPNGGGSYTVARENLGPATGLIAAASLMVDYTLTAAVGISAGVGALISAVPGWQPYTLWLCLGILAVLFVVNLRGTREAGVVFMLPTYLFVLSLLTVIAIGVFRVIAGGGQPHPAVPPVPLPPATAAAGVWLLLQAFASGCTAMTGVEAVSNGVTSFREPVAQSAQRTLTAIIAILLTLLAGIAYLSNAYHIGAADPNKPGYQSVLSQLVAAVAGRGVFYFITIGAVLLVLALSANTAFAGFPQLCRTVAVDGYLPNSFASRGRRLVYSQGIYVLAALTSLLLILFKGVTDRLIPLFAIGALLAFTFSQAGMVIHWKREKHPGKMFVNGLGAVATAITAAIVLVAKFITGAWVVVLLIPALVLLMSRIHRHYDRVAEETASPTPLDITNLQPPFVIVPIMRWGKLSKKALSFALNLSPEIQGLHIDSEETAEFCRRWREYVDQPVSRAGLKPPELVVIKSPYRWVISPIIDHVLKMEREHPERQIAVLIPELVEHRWYQYFLHNQRAAWLKAALLVKGNQRIIVINVPWYLGT